MRAATRLATLAFLVGLGCLKVVDPPPDASSGMGLGAMDPAPTTPDAAPLPQTCEEIRYCVYGCGADPGCAARCVSGAPQAALNRYQALLRCSLDPCPQQDLDCRCNAECGYGGCLDLVDACAGRSADRFCSYVCR